ncbi:CidA/LrgA family protein [Allorhizobium pseudoryzae]|uniref:CidA/LrgA family protein n=1 Tax=Allorhizobium pseudoryzae TaxID=379684 RepID=UPI0013EA4C4C|nr:CidA/LrgA family protein [Allorhizobium pseudoryzae]
MLRGIAALLMFQLIGESIVFLTKFPVPGPVVGLVLLFAVLQLGRRLGRAPFPQVEGAANTLLSNLGLFFVPAGVGVVSLWGVLQSEAAPITIVLVVSAAVTLGITVWTFIAARRYFDKKWGA